MSSDRHRHRHRRPAGPALVALAIAALSCAGRDASVSCAPTLTCTLEDARFEPPEQADAGPPACDAAHERCRAGQLTTGGAHACAIAQAGELLCWGDDSEAQLGTHAARDGGVPEDAGPFADGGAPQDAGPLADAGDAGALADAALPADAGRTPLQLALPVVLEHVKRVSAGAAHTCAITDDRRLLCWGRNREGQVDGEPSEAPARIAVAVPLRAPTAVSAGGSHTCALGADGVSCWGSARYGQCGRELADVALAPGLVPGTRDAVEVSAGLRHTCARLSDGQVVCWGELFDAERGEPRARAEPSLVPGLDDAIEISAGAGHSCALRRNGRVVCWGENASGQLGDGTTEPSATPVEVQGLELALHVSAGGTEIDGTLVGHTCAATKSFHAQCWGRNREGQLGIGDAPDSATAQVVLGRPNQTDQPYLDEVVAIAAGGAFSCVLDHDGPVRCWGDDRAGQLGTWPDETVSFGRVTSVRRFTRHD